MIELGPTSTAPIGASAGLGCQQCPLFELCGGVYSDVDCLGDCCRNPQKCATTCPLSDHFVTFVEDAGGLDPIRNWNVVQNSVALPKYIPHLHHGFRRDRLFEWDTVALTTFDVVKPLTKKRIDSPSQLRAKFKVGRNASILLLSIGKDNRLEFFWERFDVADVANWLAQLGIKHITVPNFSFPLDVPRHEHMANRMRSLYCAEKLSGAGLSVIPHLNSYNEKDWTLWRDLLRDHPQIDAVVLEFQTGAAKKDKATWHLGQLRNLREALGRDFHLIAVAGRRHLREISHFTRLTVVDSTAFVKSHRRRIGRDLNSGTITWKFMPDMPVDVLLEHNAALCQATIERRLAFIRQFPNVESQTHPYSSTPIETNQMSFEWTTAAMEESSVGV